MPTKSQRASPSSTDALHPPWLRASLQAVRAIEPSLTEALNELRQALDCESCAILLIDRSTGDGEQHWLIAQSASDPALHYFYPIELAWEQNSVIDLPLIQSVVGKALGNALSQATENAAATPLHSADETLGWLIALRDRPSAFDERDLVFLSSTARFLAMALENTFQTHQLDTTNTSLEKGLWTLTQSRDVLRALIDNLPFCIYIIDPDFHLTAINQVRAHRVGRSPNQLVGQRCYEVLFQRQTVCPGCQVLSTFTQGQKQQRIGSDHNPNALQFWEISSYPIHDAQGKISQAILLEQDITDRQNLENLVAQSEQLAAIGQLAAGVAHEINNPLTAILANAQLLQREIPRDDDKQELVDLILQASERATQVVRSLLDLARLENYEFSATNVNDSIRRAIELVKHELIANTIHFDHHLSEGLPPIQASPSHLQGVWMNLLLNAVDSLDKKPGEIQITSERMGDKLLVRIRDNGKGIAPEMLPRIFDPFFTTKSAGHGTGLGLSVCNRVIQKHGGQIQVESEPGNGSQFVVILPINA